MRCRTARHLMDLQFDGELDEARLPLLLRHLERCPRCAAEHRRLTHQEALLRSVLPRPDPTQVEIERGVARVAGILGQSRGPAPLPRSRRARWGWAAASALACLVILALLWGPRWLGRPRPIADAGGVVLSRDHGWIAYAKADGLYVRQLPAGDARRVAGGPCSSPTWAPDGTRLAFLRREGQGYRLLVANIAARGERSLLTGAPGETLENPQWAPKGGWILLVRARNGAQRHSAELWLVDAGSAVPRKVDDLGPLPKRLQAWAPDARYFAFVRWAKRGPEYAVGQPEGRPRRLASVGGVQDPQLAWAPDGRHLVYASGTGLPESGALWLAELDHPVRQLTPPGAIRDPAWAPSGTRICYTEGHKRHVGQTQDQKGGLHLADTQRGLGPLTHASEGTADQRPIWSPDGQRIAYERVSAKGQRRVCVVSASGGEPAPLGGGDMDERLVGWDASGTRLLVERQTRPGDDAAGRSTWLESVL
jgi:Tol biopolymer transport system component